LKNKLKNVPGFYFILFAVFAVLFIALIISSAFLNSFLSNYEISLPSSKAENMFKTYFASNDYDALYGALPAMVTGLETKQHFNEYIKSLTENKTVVYREIAIGSVDNLKKYTVIADNKQIAWFTLNLSPESGKWTPGEIQLTAAADNSATVIAQTSDKVYVNGVLLDDGYIAETVETDSCRHMPDGAEGIILKKYTVSGLLAEPSVNVTGIDGVEKKLDYNADKKEYTAEITYDNNLEEKYRDIVISAAQTYSKYMTQDASLAEVANHFYTDTDTYKNIRTTTVHFYTAHSGYDFKNVETSEFYGYDGNTFSARIKYDYEVYKSGNTKTYNCNFVLYFKKSADSGQFKVYYMAID